MAVHWKVQGDWHFDAQYWPDPSAMVREINGLGMEVMVTVWPFSHNGSLSFDKLLANGWLTQTVNASEPEPPSCPPNNRCPPGVVTLPDGLHGGLVDVTYASATQKMSPRRSTGLSVAVQQAHAAVPLPGQVGRCDGLRVVDAGGRLLQAWHPLLLA